MPTGKASEGPLYAALLTPPGEGGISVIALWGRGGDSLVAGMLKKPSGQPARIAPGRLSHGYLTSPSGVVLDEVIVAPHGDVSLEINCHGGALPAARVLDSLRDAGALIVPARHLSRPPESLSLLEREAAEALLAASTSLSARLLAAQAAGLLESSLRRASSALRQTRPALDDARHLLDALAGSASLGIALASPPVVAVVGPANAGKSSLVNALAGFDRNIVTPVPGTTRDAVRVSVAVSGVALLLVDTAGAIEPRSALDRRAAHSAGRALDSADAALLVLDRSEPLPPGFRFPSRPPLQIAVNKADLPPYAATLASIEASSAPVVQTSALHRTGLPQLSAALLALLAIPVPAPDAAVRPTIFNRRQLLCVDTALGCLDGDDLPGALAALDQCLGLS